jgi:gamma-glutamylcyclotransferase (GGCT)/AIG2-like uncharacterized protein YtfP
MFERCKDAVLGSTATLAKHRLIFQSNGRRAVANIIQDEGCSVVGALYKVSSADLINLDRFEGHPAVYRRCIVEVKTGGNRSVQAITYIMPEGKIGVPEIEYFEKLDRGFRQWGLSQIKLREALDEALKVKEQAKPFITAVPDVPTKDATASSILKKWDKKKIHTVFVYGTLLKGQGNHGLLKNATFLGKGKVIGKWDMYHLGGFPAIVRGNTINPVIGEAYKVSEEELARLDILEGYVEGRESNMYNRAMVDITLDNGEKIDGFVYYMKIKKEGANWKKVRTGDWATYMKDKDEWRAGLYAELEV